MTGFLDILEPKIYSTSVADIIYSIENFFMFTVYAELVQSALQF